MLLDMLALPHTYVEGLAHQAMYFRGKMSAIENALTMSMCSISTYGVNNNSTDLVCVCYLDNSEEGQECELQMAQSLDNN